MTIEKNIHGSNNQFLFFKNGIHLLYNITMVLLKLPNYDSGAIFIVNLKFFI